MQGKKEVAKTSAKLVELETASAYGTAIVERADGRATISEARVGGKKYALVIGGTEKAEMSGSSSK